MKIAGWIFSIIGILSLLGAAIKGHSAFGPCFWLALGIFLLYKSYNQKDESKENKNSNEMDSPKEISHPVSKIIPSHHDKTVPSTNNNEYSDIDGPETIQEIQSQLTIEQREASVCLISFFGGYIDETNQDSSIMYIYRQATTFFGVSSSPMEIASYMVKFDSFDVLINTLKPIKSRKAKEFLLLTCYDLSKISNKEEPITILQKIASEMGYDKTKLSDLINQYE